MKTVAPPFVPMISTFDDISYFEGNIKYKRII